MVLGFLKANQAPIAIDFGYSELKLLQIAPGEPREVVAAGCLEIPEDARHDQSLRFEYIGRELPSLLRDGQFRGKQAVCTIPAWQTFVQHLQVNRSDAQGDMSDVLKFQLQSVIACDPSNIVVRHVESCDVRTGTESLTEVICFAVSRDIVMSQVDLLKRCKLEITGLHAEPIAVLQAFHHLYRRQDDHLITTLYVDIGANCTKAMIAHGRSLRFAKTLPVGGRHFDLGIADTLECDPTAAQVHRLAEIGRVNEQERSEAARIHSQNESSGGALLASAMYGGAMARAEGDTSARDGGVEVHPAMLEDERRRGEIPSELGVVADAQSSSYPLDELRNADSAVRRGMADYVEQIVDELQMCVRYHSARFPERSIDRAIFVGGESRDLCLDRVLSRSLGIPTFNGDPLSRLSHASDLRPIGLEKLGEQPGWTVAAGLCECPSEL